MATLTDQNQYQPFLKSIFPSGTNKALALLQDIRVGSDTDSSGEDALTVLNRKLEAAGVLASGSADPVFANETALIYHQTTSGSLFIRGASSYTEISNEGTDTTVIPVYIDHANYPAINRSATWDGTTFNVPTTGSVDWLRSIPGSLTNTLWMRIYFLKGNNQIVFTDAIPIRQVSAEDITYSPQGSGNIPSSVDNVKEGLDAFHTATLGGGGTGTDDQTAAEVSTATGNFNNNLSSANTNVQSALETLDDIDFPPEQKASWPRRSGAIDATGVSQTFTVIPALINERTNYEEGIFIEAEADIQMQADSGAAGDNATFVLDVVTGPSDASTMVESDPVTLTESTSAVPATIRLTGILPSDFTTGKLRIRRTATSRRPPPATGFEGFRLQLRLSVQADEVIVNDDDLGNNLRGSFDNLEEIISEVDELPIQPADFEDVAWTGLPNGITDASPESHTITFHENLQNVNNRPGHTVVARISFNAVIASGTGGAITQLTFVHRVTAGGTPIDTTYTTNRTGTTHSINVPVDNNAISVIVRITNNTGQSDGRLIITNYRCDYLLGIDASGFTSGNLTTTDNTVQDVAQKFHDYTPSAVSIDASGFGGTGNLATTDDTVQEVANKFNAYVPMPTAANTSIANPTSSNTFYDPNNVIGGIRGYPGLVANPGNVRDALRTIDRRLADAYNPFQSTQLLDQFLAGNYTDSFSPTTLDPGTYSSEVDIPQELIDLGTDVDIRIRLHVQSISNFRGDIGLTTGGTTTLIPGTVRESVSDNVYDPNDYVTFERTVSAANVPETFRVHFRRTAGSITLNQGFADVIDSDGGGAMGGAGGQSAGYTSTIIWLAGASINDRLTIASETTNYTLMSGHNFSDYDQIVFVFDGGSGPNQPLMPMWVDSNLFQAFGAGGTLWIMGNWWLMVSRQSDNTFRFRWRGANNGLRRIIGISTS